MKASIENNELVIRLPLQTPTLSSTGKTLVVASSHGNVKTSVAEQRRGVQFPAQRNDCSERTPQLMNILPVGTKVVVTIPMKPGTIIGHAVIPSANNSNHSLLTNLVRLDTGFWSMDNSTFVSVMVVHSDSLEVIG